MRGSLPPSPQPASDIPLLWLCGPPGVGKTAVAWEVYRRLVAMGVRTAYLDVDQLGMCHPEPADDPDRHRLKARNVAALRRNFAAAGATCLVVSGVVDAARGPATDILGDHTLVGRLRVDRDQMAARLRERRGSYTVAETAALEAELLDRSRFADWVVDTTAISIRDAAQQVLELSRPLLEQRGNTEEHQLPPRPVGAPGSGEILWLTGVTGVGKSTVGFRAYLKVLSAGVPAAFVDAGQLGFLGRSTDHRLRARNLASVWANDHSVGASALVVVGPVETHADAQCYQQTLPHVSFTWCRLHASPRELTRRVLSRRDGGSWPQPGDPLKDRPAEELIALADRAIAHDALLEAHGVGLRVTVDGLAADEAATSVLERAAWPTGRPRR